MVVKRDPFSAPPIILFLFVWTLSISVFVVFPWPSSSFRRRSQGSGWFGFGLWFLSQGLGYFAPASVLSLDGFLLVRGSELAGCCCCSYELLSFVASCSGFGSLWTFRCWCVFCFFPLMPPLLFVCCSVVVVVVFCVVVVVSLFCLQ